MSTNTTTQPAKTRKHWSKKKRYAVLAGIPLAAVATTAAAAAIFAALAGIQGTGTNGDFTAKFSSGAAPVLDASAMTVKPAGSATIAGDKLVLPDLTIYPGEAFTVEAAVVAGAANQAGYISGLTMPGLPAGYTATLESGCGQKVTNSLAYVKVKVQAPATQTPGAAWSLTNQAGVRVSPLASASTQAPSGVTCAPFVAQ